MLNVFISFSRRSDYSLVAELAEFVNTNSEANNLLCAKATEVDPEKNTVKFDQVLVGDFESSKLSPKESPKLKICYDELVLGNYGSLDDLTTTVSQADNIVFLISEHFFQSYYCIEELRRAYNNFSDKLTPVVVLTENCQLEAISLNAIEDYWRTQNPENIKKIWIKQMLQDLPLFHSWLLGSKDINTGKFNTKFPLLDASKNDVVEEIVNELINPRVLHFPIHSESQFKEFYKKELEQVFDAIDPKQKIRFAQTVCAQYGLASSFEDFLLTSRTPVEADQLLQNISNYLSGELRTAKSDNIRLYGNIRVVVSAVLFSMVDFKALQLQIHAINRSEYATILLGNTLNKRWQVQFIVACLTKSLAMFKLVEGAVAGAGELPEIESGASLEDIVERQLTEEVWFDLLWRFASILGVFGDTSKQADQYKRDSESLKSIDEQSLEQPNVHSNRNRTLSGHLYSTIKNLNNKNSGPLTTYLTVSEGSELDVDIELRNLLHEVLSEMPIIKMNSATNLTAQSVLKHDENIHWLMGTIYGQLQVILISIDKLVNRNELLSKDLIK